MYLKSQLWLEYYDRIDDQVVIILVFWGVKEIGNQIK